ncbi:MAG TPA: hypothetical protein VE981_11395 [Planctomycetota bacterium]|nr:hypothetical protein [Planctomycetota bacterium]
MKAGTLRRLAALAVLAAWGGSAAAQQAAPQIPQPKIYALQPAGGKAGSSVDVRITSGSDLDGADRLLFSHPGITAQVLKEEATRIYPQGRIVEGRFKVTIAGDVPPGVYEVRAAGYFGVTNARRFAVGDREEVAEKEPNNDPATAQEPALGSVVNGLCDPQGYDCYRLPAKKGGRYIVEAQALKLDSRAQVVLTLIDPSGREIRRIAGTRSRDALLDFTADHDGGYVVKVSDLLYRGGDEFFYRLTIGTGPWIDYVDPPVLKPGVDNAVTVYGRNLPGGAPAEGLEIDGRPIDKLAVTIKAPATAEPPTETLMRPGDASVDLLSWRLGGSNPVRLLLADDAVSYEKEPNDSPEQAQAVSKPAVVVGRFNPRGDRDWYVVDAAKGEKLWIEVVSQRLGLAVDPQIVIQQAGEASKDLQEVDDLATPLPAMPNNVEKRYRAHSEDPALVFTAPADGKYRILVRDQFGSAQGDQRLAYVLLVRAPKPDFRLVAFPVETTPVDGKLSQVNCIVRRGGSDRLRVIAYRREGFDGAIRLEAEGLPAGLSARPAVIGAGGDTSADFILKAEAGATAFAGPIRIVGRSGDLARPVRSAEVLFNVADMQKEPVMTRITDTVSVAVDDHFTAPLAIQVVPADPQRMARGGKLKIPVKLVKNADLKDLDKAQVKFVASGLPGRNNEKPIAAKELTLSLAKPDGELELDVTDKAPLGPTTFHLTGDVDVNYVRNPERVKRAQDEQKRIDAVAVEVATEAKKSGEEKAKADKDASEAAAAVAKLKAAGQAEAPLQEAQDKAKAADELKAKAAETEKKAQDLVKAADTAKKEWADELKKATDASKEKKIKVWFSSTSIALEIAAAPATLKPANEPVVIKAGGQTEVSVEVVREFGFADEVKLELAAGGAPVKLVQPVTVAGNAPSAPLLLAADKGAKPGTYTVTLHGQLKFNAKPATAERTLQVVIEPAPAAGQ